MYPIDPGEAWGKSIIIAENQSDTYNPLYARLHPSGITVTRWRLTNSEREAIANGHDLLLMVMQFGQPFHPVQLHVEGIDYGG